LHIPKIAPLYIIYIVGHVLLELESLAAAARRRPPGLY